MANNTRLQFTISGKEVKLLVLIGLLFRIVLFAMYRHVTIFPDSDSFIVLGKALSDLDLAGYSGYRSPGYPLLLALGFGSVGLVVVYQFILGIAASVLWYKTLLNLGFTSKAAFWLVLFLEAFLHVLLFETAILTETLTLFIVSLLFWILAGGYFEKKSIRLELGMGLLLGFLVLVKPFFAFLPFLIYGFSVLKNFSLKKIVQQKIIILVFPLVAYFGWSYVNKINTGYFVSTTFYGLNIAQNCVYFAEKGPSAYQWIIDPYVKHREISIREKKDVSMAIWQAYGNQEFSDRNLSFAALSDELGKYGKQTIKDNPGDYMEQVVFRSWFDFWRFFDIRHACKFENPKVDKAMTGVWFLQKGLLQLFKLAFLLLIPFYFYRFLKDRKITHELVIVSVIFAASVLQGLVTYGTNAKYSFPFEYLMIVVVVLFLKNFSFSRRLGIFRQ